MGKCCDIPFAAMRKRLILQAETQTPDGQGGFTTAWADEATIFASLDPAKGYERYQGMQTQTPLSHKVTTRYRSGITTAKRLKYGTRVFGIKEVLNVEEDNRIMEIKAIELT